MSFRLFVYWCALCGGWAAALGWFLGQVVVKTVSLGGTGIKGMFLGMLIAFGIGLVDALWVFSLRQIVSIVPRILVCMLVGTVGGLFGAFIGQLLSDWEYLLHFFSPNLQHDLLVGFQIFGWVLMGLMVGVSIGTYDFMRVWVREEELRFVAWKMVRGIVGGGVGGLLGGLLDWKLTDAGYALFPGKTDLWMPSLIGFIVLGLCIGLLIGVAQVVLKEAWIRIEKGFRQGREMLVNKPVLTIGRDESCDIGLFGDALIEKLHARIYQQDDRYLIADNNSPNGTFVNGARVREPMLLRSGDLIRVGNAELRFSERKKSSASLPAKK